VLDPNYGPIAVRSEPGLVVAVIDHPPTNLVGGELIGGLIGLLDALEAAADVRVVVFTSADPDFFLMHGDVESIVRIPTGPHRPADQPNVAAVTFQRLSSAPYLTIGLIDGAARGGGCEFLSALDLRYGTPRTIIGQPEVPMGILPGAGGTSRLPRLLGRDRALEIMLTGRDVDATEALAIGWLTGLYAGDEIERIVMALARRVARMPAASVAAVKRVVDLSLGDLRPVLTAETDAFGELTSSGAHVEPMRRFLEAGGQTREAEIAPMDRLIDRMINPD
jgi:enoyl-CoA hydratase/carnithine racemase